MTNVTTTQKNKTNAKATKGTLGSVCAPFFRYLAKKGLGEDQLKTLKKHWSIVEMHFGTDRKVADILPTTDATQGEKERPRTIDKMAQILRMLRDFYRETGRTAKRATRKNQAYTAQHATNRANAAKETLATASRAFFEYLTGKGADSSALTTYRRNWSIVEMHFGTQRKLAGIFQAMTDIAKVGGQALGRDRTINKMAEILGAFLNFCRETGRASWSLTSKDGRPGRKRVIEPRSGAMAA